MLLCWQTLKKAGCQTDAGVTDVRKAPVAAGLRRSHDEPVFKLGW